MLSLEFIESIGQDDDLGPIDEFRSGQVVVFVNDPGGFAWQVVRQSGNTVTIRRPIPGSLKGEQITADAGDLVASGRSIRSTVEPTTIMRPKTAGLSLTKGQMVGAAIGAVALIGVFVWLKRRRG